MTLARRALFLLWLQDQARAIKSALLERVKGIRVFLDVDDLADTSRRNPARASLPAQPWPRYPLRSHWVHSPLGSRSTSGIALWCSSSSRDRATSLALPSPTTCALDLRTLRRRTQSAGLTRLLLH